ncbi:MAG: pseudouridine synthase [Tissierellaceae bacterium]
MARKERIDKIISNMGYGSRKDVKKFIKDGLIEVNGVVIVKNDIKVDPYEDEIYFNGEKVLYREYIYLMMNKPKGLVSSTDDPMTRTVIDILDEEYIIYRPFPAGRLDKDTVGLLLITNDGKLAHELLSPKKGIDKTYYVEVDGHVDEKYIEKFKRGIMLDDGYRTLPSQLEIISSDIVSQVYLTIQEGKYHQVKRMFESISMKVIYLKRLSMGPLRLDEDLEEGEYRELTDCELNMLKTL